jgi:hypothetical protein
MSTAWFATLGTITRPMTIASRITAAIGAHALVLAACSSDAADTESSEAVDQVESTVDGHQGLTRLSEYRPSHLFAFFERPTDLTKVMFYFEGGDACFSAETCEPINGTYSPTINQTVDNLAERGGLFDATNEINPVADYSVVYVPNCTCDLHLGNATTEYSEALTIEHRGYALALQRSLISRPPIQMSRSYWSPGRVPGQCQHR